MSPSDSLRVGFVVKRYPRYSETFIVREILAHEEAGLAIEIFALRPPNDRHFQDLISRVRAPVNYLYLPAEGLIAEDLAAAVAWLTAQGVRFAPGGIRKGAAGHDITFIHPRASEQFPVGGEGVLIELVQAPPEIVAAAEG